MEIRKRNGELIHKLLEEAEEIYREEFNKLVKKGVFKDTEEDYDIFVACKYCKYHNFDTNCCTILPEESSKCPLIFLKKTNIEK